MSALTLACYNPCPMHERTATVAITDRHSTAAATRADAYVFGFTWTWRFRQAPGCH